MKFDYILTKRNIKSNETKNEKLKIDWEIKSQKLQNRRWKILKNMTNSEDEFDELY